MGVGRLAQACLGLVLTVVWSQAAYSQEVTVDNISTHLDDKVYRLDADFNYALSPPILEALNSGVVLTISLDIEVYKPRQIIWDDVLASLEQKYQLRYHALTEQYLLRNLNSGAEDVYPSADAALFFMGRVRGLPLIDAALAEEGKEYQVRLRSRLETGSLPVPLQLRTYVSSDWRLSTEWYSQPLQR
jgi:hypothetical protein